VGGDPEGGGLYVGFGGGGVRGGEAVGKPAEAAGGVLVDVRVPGGGERDAQIVGEPGSESAELAGTGDVDDVGAEAEEFALDAGEVAGKERVEGEILLEADGGEAAGELEGLELAGLLEAGFSFAGADAEEGQVVALCVGDEISAGVCDAVDLVEGVGEVGDARRTHWTTVREDSIPPRQKCAKSSK
jgi:hypothetical protein